MFSVIPDEQWKCDMILELIDCMYSLSNCGVRYEDAKIVYISMLQVQQRFVWRYYSDQGFSKVERFMGSLNIFIEIKASFTVPIIISKSTEMYTLYTNLSFYITFTMFHYIGQE